MWSPERYKPKMMPPDGFVELQFKVLSRTPNTFTLRIICP